MATNLNDWDDMEIIEPQKRALTQPTQPSAQRRKFEHTTQQNFLPPRTTTDFLPDTPATWQGGDNMWKEFIDFLYKKQ